MKNEQQRRAALVYHAKPNPGKTKVVPTKNYNTQRVSIEWPTLSNPPLEAPLL